MTTPDPLPAAAYAAALAGLPGMGPARLSALLGRWTPPDAWSAICSGRGTTDRAVVEACGHLPDSLSGRWRAVATATDVGAIWDAHRDANVTVTVLGATAYPDVLAADLEPPAVIFHRGALDAVDGPRAAIVGTRRCTRTGLAVARELGFELARAGVRVVSGLALGIDGAAHEGALEAGAAPPIGVVGSGLDVVYPRRHRQLWHAVADAGVLLGEAPLGAPPEQWRFPARNRIIAALADVVVVVESHARGGSRHTVDAALDRNVTVMAVPGSVRSPASGGTNELLAQGLPPARDVADVLMALGLSGAAPRPFDKRPAPTGPDAMVLAAVGTEPVTADDVALHTGLPALPVAAALVRLEQAGWLVRQGPWWERAG
jgi:DNA processing protein